MPLMPGGGRGSRRPRFAAAALAARWRRRGRPGRDSPSVTPSKRLGRAAGAAARTPPPNRFRARTFSLSPSLFPLPYSEAFAAWLPPFGVPLSYAIAIGYVLVDTVDKGVKAYARAKEELEGGAVPVRADVDTGRLALLLAAERSVDTIVWQLLASVFVPGYTIHTVVAAVHAGLGPLEALPAIQDAAAGLASLVGAPSGAALLAIADKSLPTVAGLAGELCERERVRMGVDGRGGGSKRACGRGRAEVAKPSSFAPAERAARRGRRRSWKPPGRARIAPAPRPCVAHLSWERSCVDFRTRENGAPWRVMASRRRSWLQPLPAA